MRRALIGVLLALLAMNMTGCGGCSGTSEADMRARASKIRRSKDNEDDPPAAQAQAPVATAVNPAEGTPPAAVPAPVVAPAVPAVPPPPVGTTAAPAPTAAPGEPAADGSQPAVSPAAAQVVVIDNAPPERPLSPSQRRERTVRNLEKIGAALSAYVAKNGRLPAASSYAADRSKLLSWRVELLPYLGYDALYKQFRLNEPWDSLHNKKLLAQIPPEYQSPERFDTSTNYLAPNANNTPITGRNTPMVPSTFAAGPHNVIVIVEADDSLAAPWSKPQDFEFDEYQPRLGLGTLRPDGLLVVACDGSVVLIPSEAPDTRIAGLFTMSGAGIPLGAVAREAIAEETQPIATSVAGSPTTLAGGTAPGANVSGADPASPEAAAAAMPEAKPRVPVPGEEALKKARGTLRDVYAKDYEAAKSREAKLQLANKMLADAEGVRDNAADYHELLRIVRDVAVAAGSIDVAFRAVDRMSEHFAIDGAGLKVKSLEEINKQSRGREISERLTDEARTLVQQAIEEDNFEAARKACELMVMGARMTNDRKGVEQATDLRKAVDRMQVEYSVVPGAMNTLQQNPGDPHAGEIVGKYLCFVKGQWEIGLPLLAKAPDIKLRGMAMVDLDPSKPPESMVQLADQYMDMAREQKSPLDRGMKLRAAYYYAKAADKLTGGLDRIKAQKRLDELRELFGRQWLDNTLGLAPPPAAETEEED